MTQPNISLALGSRSGRETIIDKIVKSLNPEENWQNVRTPFWVCDKMCDLIAIPQDKINEYKYLVMFSLELLDVLLNGKEGEMNIVRPLPENILFIADHKIEELFAKKAYKVQTILADKNKGIKYLFDSLTPILVDKWVKKSYGINGAQMPKLTNKNLIVLMNPPYQQKSDKQNTRLGISSIQAKPIYHNFITTIIDNLSPSIMISIHPSRWMLGGMGLDFFRKRMLSDNRIEEIVDYKGCNDIFENVDIAGGVQILKWNKNYSGLCKFNNIERELNKYDIVIREHESLTILEKVLKNHKKFLTDKVSSCKPYGIPTNAVETISGQPCWFKRSVGKAFVDENTVTKKDDISKWKILIPRAPIAGQTDFSKPVGFFNENSLIIANPGEICTETYLVGNSFETKNEANNFKNYMLTKFFRFMLLLRVVSQDVTKERYAWVPDLEDYSIVWTDEMLKEKFGLTNEEWAYIESKIK